MIRYGFFRGSISFFFPSFFLSLFFFSVCFPNLISFLGRGEEELLDCVGLDRWGDIIYRDHLSFLSRND